MKTRPETTLSLQSRGDGADVIRSEHHVKFSVRCMVKKAQHYFCLLLVLVLLWRSAFFLYCNTTDRREQITCSHATRLNWKRGRCGGTSVQIVRQLLEPLGLGKDGVHHHEPSELKQIVSVEGEGYRGAVYPR